MTRRGDRSGRARPMAGLELAVCAFVLAAVIAVLIIFLLVFHDVPLRVV